LSIFDASFYTLLLFSFAVVKGGEVLQIFMQRKCFYANEAAHESSTQNLPWLTS